MIIIGNSKFSGRNVTISNNRVIIDGKDVTDNLPEQKTYNIQVDGNIDRIKCDACDKIIVTGEVGQIQTQSGDVECGNVKGSVSTMSGDVDCDSISGSVSTMSGDIKHRRR